MSEERRPKNAIDNVIDTNKKFFKASACGFAGLWIWPAAGVFPVYADIGLKVLSVCFLYNALKLSLSAMRNIYGFERAERAAARVKAKGVEQQSDGFASYEDLKKGGAL